MLKTRVIPCLLLKDNGLVKTVQFKNPKYVGDPTNTVRIFNELEVDELLILDIGATPKNTSPRFELLQQFTNECFMPLGYGGGITSLAQAKKLIELGMEKIVVNSAAHSNPTLIRELSDYFGSQAVIVSIDVKKSFFGKYAVYTQGGTLNTKKNPLEWAQELETLGAGELLLTSIDREGMWKGFDIPLIRTITSAVDVPVIACGGAGSTEHIREVVQKGGASAVALGSMVVFQGPGLGVLVNFPDRAELEKALNFA